MPSRWQWLHVHEHAARVAGFVCCLVVAVIAAILQWYVLTRFSFSEEPWNDFGVRILRMKDFVTRILLKWWPGTMKLPHDGVYARLMPSAIHGVGVFAIMTIPKDTYVFEPDDGVLVSVETSKTEGLTPPLRKLYEDFCVLNRDKYACPVSLNLLTPAWYLNSSKHPNMAADSRLRFYAVREIAAGEELTVDYDTYSQNQTNVQPAAT